MSTIRPSHALGIALVLATARHAEAAPPAKPRGAPASAADAKKQCVEAYEQTQALRNTGRLRSARAQAMTCSDGVCPKVLRKDCVAWTTEIEASLPSVVFEVHDSKDKETSAVRVSVDGEVMLESLSGKAIEVDPGEHRFRYEIVGEPPIEEMTLIREGEKNRKIRVSAYKAPSSEDAGAVAERSRSRRVGALVLGGVGVLGLGTFATLALVGTNRRAQLDSTCAPRCSHADVDALRAELFAADVALGVGVAALGTGAFLYFTAPSKPTLESPREAAWTGGLVPLAGGGFASIRASF